MIEDYVNGYIQRTAKGTFEGVVSIDGITLPSIVGVYFEDEGNKYLWLRRKKVLEYDFESQMYKERDAKPQFEAYLKKQIDDGAVAYKGEFIFMRFKYSITGLWDRVLGNDKQRLNLFVERLPLAEQTIINSINETKRNKK